VHPANDGFFLPLRIPFRPVVTTNLFGVILPAFCLLVNKIPKKCPKTPVPMSATGIPDYLPPDDVVAHKALDHADSFIFGDLSRVLTL